MGQAKAQHYILDVREFNEYTAGHVDGAIHLPVGEIASNSAVLKDIPLDADLIVYCRSGARAGMACNILQAKGYTSVTNGVNQASVEAIDYD